MQREKRQPIIFLVSAPSGAGKTTLCEMLKKEFGDSLYTLVTATTRPMRPGEVESQSYFFLTPQEFARRVQAGGFLEHATVHGNSYGSPREQVFQALEKGQDVLMNVDVQGAASVRAALAQTKNAPPLVDIFVAPPSLDALRSRLTHRGQDSAEVIERRLQQSSAEMARWREYRYLVINDDLKTAHDQIRAIVIAERARIRK
ncbi:MAG: guanylate kinase [Verrucomicrobia bacterium]|nr:MAG: guanylate kinase [Verrucomicrobiota bacterium]